MTLTNCEYRTRCVLANLPQSQASGYFQPRNTGEFCDHYTPKASREYSNDLVERLTQMAGMGQ